MPHWSVRSLPRSSRSPDLATVRSGTIARPPTARSLARFCLPRPVVMHLNGHPGSCSRRSISGSRPPSRASSASATFACACRGVGHDRDGGGGRATSWPARLVARGDLAAVVLSTSLMQAVVGRLAIMDALLDLAVALACWHGSAPAAHRASGDRCRTAAGPHSPWARSRRARSPRSSRAWSSACGSSGSAPVVARNPPAPGRWLAGFALFVALVLPWAYSLYVNAGPVAIRNWSGHYTVGRYMGTIENQSGPLYYYMPVVILGSSRGSRSWCPLCRRVRRSARRPGRVARASVPSVGDSPVRLLQFRADEIAQLHRARDARARDLVAPLVRADARKAKTGSPGSSRPRRFRCSSARSVSRSKCSCAATGSRRRTVDRPRVRGALRSRCWPVRSRRCWRSPCRAGRVWRRTCWRRPPASRALHRARRRTGGGGVQADPGARAHDPQARIAAERRRDAQASRAAIASCSTRGPACACSTIPTRISRVDLRCARRLVITRARDADGLVATAAAHGRRAVVLERRNSDALLPGGPPCVTSR